LVYVAIDSLYAGCIIISDVIKSTAADAVISLKSAGIKNILMLTGDNEQTAKETATLLGIKSYKANLLPEDKVSEIEKCIKRNRKTAFVGDGINDAPVLSRADIGIAMGALGSDAAIEAADVVLMDDNPAKLATAMEISRKTLTIARQNILFALLVKALVLVLVALGLAGMWLAVFADVGVSVLAILNAMRTLRFRPSAKFH